MGISTLRCLGLEYILSMKGETARYLDLIEAMWPEEVRRKKPKDKKRAKTSGPCCTETHTRRPSVHPKYFPMGIWVREKSRTRISLQGKTFQILLAFQNQRSPIRPILLTSFRLNLR